MMRGVRFVPGPVGGLSCGHLWANWKNKKHNRCDVTHREARKTREGTMVGRRVKKQQNKRTS
jgi:hypothetical protein